MAFILIVLFLSVLPLDSYAVINMESVKSDRSDGGMKGEFSHSFKYSKGNNDVWGVGFGFRLENKILDKSNKNESDSLLLFGNVSVGENNGFKDSESGFVHLRYTKFLSLRSGIEFFSQYQHDRFQRLNSRILLGSNYRYLLYKSKNSSVSSGMGLMQENEKLKDGPSSENNIRVNIYIAWRSKASLRNFSLGGAFYFQPKLSDTKDYRELCDFSISFPLMPNIFYMQTMNMASDSRPPSGVDKNDLSYFHSVKYQF